MSYKRTTIYQISQVLLDSRASQKESMIGSRKPHVFLTCEYCGMQKIRVIVNGRGAEIVLMYSKRIPYHPDNPFLALIQKSRQIWICHYCIDKLK